MISNIKTICMIVSVKTFKPSAKYTVKYRSMTSCLQRKTVVYTLEITNYITSYVPRAAQLKVVYHKKQWIERLVENQ